MYQQIRPHVYHNEYHPVPPVKGDIVLSYDGNNILMKKDRTFFHYEEVDPSLDFYYLFEIDSTHFYLADLSKMEHISLSVQTMRGYQPKHMSFAGITGWQIYTWLHGHQYCGKCGSPFIHDRKERAQRCPKCGNIVYPVISPAVIVGVINDEDQLLVTQYASGSYQKYALVAGFNEVGESIEETCRREVKEETGIEISEMEYYGCQPWAYSSSILFGFFARSHGRQEIQMDSHELRTAKWVSRKDVYIDPQDETALTAEMIRHYLYEGKKRMNYNRIIYQIYPIGFCGAPRINDGVTVNRIQHVTEWIPHMEKLGVTTVLFNPLFESDAHGYDTRDMTKVDCRLGTNTDFAEVCEALHDHDMEVILDGVFNHVGRSFPYFLDVIHNRENSAYKDWFIINFHDHNGPDGFWYECWEGHQELVKLNLDNPQVRQWLLSTVDSWIEQYRIDGLRLDVAYMLNRTFMRELCDHVRASHPDFLFIGEMIGGDYNVLMNDHLLDSVTNYECRKGIYSSFNDHNLCEIGFSLNRQFANENWTLYRGSHLLSFCDNHDVDRIASILKEKNHLAAVYALLTAMPGIPCIYYGSEWGEEGRKGAHSDDDLRPYFEQPVENELSDYVSRLNHMRLSHQIFTDGDYRQIQSMNEHLAFSRNLGNETLIFAVNIGNNPATVYGNMPSGHFKDLMTGKEMEINGNIPLHPGEILFLYRK